MLSLDLNAYLTPEATAWCELTYNGLGRSGPPKVAEFLQQVPERVNLIPKWYIEFVGAAREYVRCGGSLNISAILREGYEWFIRPEIAEMHRRDVDTYGKD